MKKRLTALLTFPALLFCAICGTVLLSGCANSSNTDIINEEEQVQSAAEITDNAMAATEDKAYPTYDVLYSDYTAGRDIDFQSILKDNPIDAAFEQELNEAVYNVDINSIYGKYADIWKEEMGASADYLLTLLDDDEQKEALLKAQEDFETALTEEVEIARKILGRPYLGTSFPSVICGKYIEGYRDRTFELKYLAYYYERAINGDRYSDVNDYPSLKFYH